MGVSRQESFKEPSSLITDADRTAKPQGVPPIVGEFFNGLDKNQIFGVKGVTIPEEGAVLVGVNQDELKQLTKKDGGPLSKKKPSLLEVMQSRNGWEMKVFSYQQNGGDGSERQGIMVSSTGPVNPKRVEGNFKTYGLNGTI